MCELRHWPSIAVMLPQSHCGDEEDGRIGFLRDFTIYVYALSFVLGEHSVCRELTFVLINVFMLLA